MTQPGRSKHQAEWKLGFQALRVYQNGILSASHGWKWQGLNLNSWSVTMREASAAASGNATASF
jgi:hypothetical protein